MIIRASAPCSWSRDAQVVEADPTDCGAGTQGLEGPVQIARLYGGAVLRGEDEALTGSLPVGTGGLPVGYMLRSERGYALGRQGDAAGRSPCLRRDDQQFAANPL